MPKRLLLIGAGHAHLTMIRDWNEAEKEEMEWVLISPGPYHYYSGMFSGLMEGLYRKEEVRVELGAFCRRHGGSFLEGAAVKIDYHHKQVQTDRGDTLFFDAASINIGAGTAGASRGTGSHVLKPALGIPETVERMRHADRPAVIGSGYGGVEMALSLQAWRQKHRREADPVRLFSSGGIMPDETKQIQHAVRKILQKRKVQIIEEGRVGEKEGLLHTDNGRHSFDEALWLTGSAAHPLFQASSLPTAEDESLRVNTGMQVPGMPELFGAGDSVTMDAYPALPKNGVYAIRQAPVLKENITSFFQGGTTQLFTPQKNYTAILSTGGKKGLLIRGRLHFKGSAAWRLKNRIDKKFMASLHS